MRCDNGTGNIQRFSVCFNPHTYMRCDRYSTVQQRIRSVSIHTPTWGVTGIVLCSKGLGAFQSTHLHEVWLVRETTISKAFKVSIHTPTWGVTNTQIIPGKNQKSFNPHTYMRCDEKATKVLKTIKVSIHTPTWGVTQRQLLWLYAENVSIHTPTWGVTLRTVIFRSISLFQSTHLHEVWPEIFADILNIVGFNPHTYMRCDLLRSSLFWFKNSFNPHTYMRCDIRQHSFFYFYQRFNPHTYMRCDGDRYTIDNIIKVSIHTPTWGVTLSPYAYAPAT